MGGGWGGGEYLEFIIVIYRTVSPIQAAAAAAAAAKSLQSCPTLCDPIDSSPSGSLTLGFSRPRFPSPKYENEK